MVRVERPRKHHFCWRCVKRVLDHFLHPVRQSELPINRLLDPLKSLFYKHVRLNALRLDNNLLEWQASQH